MGIVRGIRGSERGRRTARLTALDVRRAKPASSLADGDNLYLAVKSATAKSWVFRYELRGRRREMGLGSARIFTLAEAREMAREARKLLAAGRDPLDERNAQRNAARLEKAREITFRACAERYIASYKAGWRSAKHARLWPNSLAAYVYPIFGELPVQAIDVGLVLKALEPLWTTKPDTASRIRGRIEAVLDFAAARGFRSGENPARWRGHLENLLPRVSQVANARPHPAMPFAEVPQFLAELRQQDGVTERGLEFLILTAARTGEVVNAKWSEIDFAGRQWVVPADRMKAGKEHRVPLSGAALRVLAMVQPLRSLGDYLFPGRRTGYPLWQSAMRRVLVADLGRPGLSVHGFRASFRTWVAEATDFPGDIAEAALAHVTGTKTELAYRRGDFFKKRRQLMDAWGGFLEGGSVQKLIAFPAQR